jgi:repressor LexA
MSELEEKELKALKELRNFFMHNGHFPTVRELSKLLGYSSSRSAYLLLSGLINKGALRRKDDGGLQILVMNDQSAHAQTVEVPLVGAVACGIPILAQENIETFITVSTKLAPSSSRHFLLRARGNSMDQAGINNGDLVLVRQQTTAENGDIVVALVDDSATVKEFHKHGDTILLKPKSSDPIHKPIVLTNDFIIQGKVVTTITNL